MERRLVTPAVNVGASLTSVTVTVTGSVALIGVLSLSATFTVTL